MIYGSLEWARATGGRLRGAQKWAELWSLAVARLLARRRPAGFTSSRQWEQALAETALPDSPAVRACQELVAGLGPPPLVGHVVRTHVWGTLLGLRDGLAWDRELFALAALLHDLALARRRHAHECFAYDGADQAQALLEPLGVEAARRERVAQAICLHLRTAVPVSLGVEAHLVHAGAALDVVGRRAFEIPKGVQRSVLEVHPRDGLVEVLCDTFDEERRQHPEARVSRWWSWGFAALIRENPLSRAR